MHIDHYLFLSSLLSLVSATPTPPLHRRAGPPQSLPCDYKFFTQSIDHFGKHDGTFQQRYSIVEDFFKPGGPILFYQAEEITYPECANNTVLYDWAQEVNGLVVSLEHRYFGTSKPFGNASSSVENMKYLTLDNVMDDAVAFLDQVKRNHTGAEDSKVVMASGSYGGFLSAAFRINRPKAIYGSVASAGPVKGVGNSSDPSVYGWWMWTNQVYQDKSHLASKKIQHALKELDKVIASGNVSSLQETFNTCDPLAAEWMPVFKLYVLNTYTLAAEFNYHIPRPILNMAFPLEKFIAIAEEEPDPLKLLSRSAWLYWDAMDIKCFDLQNPDFLNKVVTYIEQPYFRYITCAYMPMNAASYTGNGLIFPPNPGNDANSQICKQEFGIDPPTVEEWESTWHFTQQDIANSTRIIWSRGEYDATSAVEPSEADLPLTTDRMRSRTLFAPDMAHIEDLFRSHPGDRAGVKWIRTRELEIIKGWLDPIEVF